VVDYTTGVIGGAFVLLLSFGMGHNALAQQQQPFALAQQQQPFTNTTTTNMTAASNATIIVNNATTGAANATNATAASNATITNPTNMTTTTAANATNANPTVANATRIITNLTWADTGEVQILSAQNIQYQKTDPVFSKLAQLTSDCLDVFNTMAISGPMRSAENIQKQDFCTDVIRQGIDQFCQSTDFATFDLSKCEEAKKMSGKYVVVVEYLYG
jgi:hypothetical protein